MPLAMTDVLPMTDEVGRFARERVAPAASRPEQPTDQATLNALSAEAAELGIIPVGGDSEGLGLWAEPTAFPSMAFSMGALARVGEANVGTAFAWHRAALARWVASQGAPGVAAASALADSVPPADSLSAATLPASALPGGALDLTIAPTGHYGLARLSVARWLRGATLDADDQAMLRDWLDRTNHATTITAPHDWKTLIWPVWHDGRVAWQCTQRDALVVQACHASHGLDELAVFRVRSRAPADGKGDSEAGCGLLVLDDEQSRALLRRTLRLDWTGLLTIALAALERGYARACEFAALRRQGGTVIANHAAVQRMLSDIDVARRQGAALVTQLAKPVDDVALVDVAAARATLHPALCHAANQVMQVYGGLGYMRDAGPEKLVRDQQMLQWQGGGVEAAHLFVAGWGGGAT